MYKFRKQVATFAVLFAEVLLLALSSMAHHHHGERICFGSPERCPLCVAEHATTATLPASVDLDGETMASAGATAHACGNHHDGDVDCDLRSMLFTYGRAHMQLAASENGENGGDAVAGLAMSWALLAAVVSSVPQPVLTGEWIIRRADPSGRLVQGAFNAVSLRAPPFFIA